MFNQLNRFRPRITTLLLAFLFSVSSPLHICATEERTAEEAHRLSLLHGLIEQRAVLAKAGNTAGLQQCDARIRNHPAPPDSNTALLVQRLVGTWRSPRRDSLYRADGSWTVLSAERGGLHGRWHIAGNRLEIASGYAEPLSTEKYTIIMVSDEDFVFADRETVFFEKRLPPPGNGHKHSANANR